MSLVNTFFARDVTRRIEHGNKIFYLPVWSYGQRFDTWGLKIPDY